MGFLDSIKRAYNYIVGDDTDKKVADAKKKPNNDTTTKKASNSPNSIHRPDGGTIGTNSDVVVKTTNTQTTKTNNQQTKSKQTKANQTKKTQTNISQADIDKIIATIEQRCNEYNIAYEDVIKQMNFSYEEYEKASIKEKYRILVCIDAALSMQILYMNQDKIAKNTDKTQFISQIAEIYNDVTQNGEIYEIKAFKARLDTIISEACKKFNEAQTEEEKFEALDSARLEIEQQISEEANIKKKGVSKKEQEKIDEHAEDKIRAGKRIFGKTFAATADAKNIKYVVLTNDGKEFAATIQETTEMLNEEAKAIFNDSLDHDFIVKIAEFKYEHDDYVPADVYGNGIEYSMQYKTAEAARKFEQDAYEYRQKVENGEIDAPWMSKEHLNAETAAIGAGISANKNMTSEERAELLNKWNEHVTNSNDSDIIIENYNNRIEQQNNVSKVISTMAGADQKQNDVTVKVVNRKGSKKELEDALTTLTFSVVKKKYPQNSERELVEIVLHNPKLKGHKADIVSYLKTYSPEELYDVTKGCNTDMFCFVLRNISPENAGKLYDLSESDKCYAARKLGEKIIEEGNNNAAA